jgi:hypothetical protein
MNSNYYQSRGGEGHKQEKRHFWGLALCWLAIVLTQDFLTSATAGPLSDPSNASGFFTNVASRLLSSEMNLDLGHIEIYPTNQYTPAVHRLLQVTANILDAENTNFYPSVFRPLFSEDASNEILIIGFQQVTNVSGPADPQLSTPYDVTELLNEPSGTNSIADANGPVNIYGVPWVVGAKQGLPNFNQLSLVSAAQVTRKLELTRTSVNPATATYATNQMYIIGITNSLGISFWNAYSNAYPRPLTVYAADGLATTLANDFYSWTAQPLLVTNWATNSWPGSRWSGRQPGAIPQTAAFLSFNWADTFQSPLAYSFNTHTFQANPTWENTEPPLPPLSEFRLAVTNYLQAFILDGSNVIDYVQLCSPAISGSLTEALADPNFPSPNNVYYQWSTNSNPTGSATPFGVLNQLWVSGHPSSAPAEGGQWSAAPTPMGTVAPTAEAAYFNGFFTPTFQYDGQMYKNLQLEMQAPYTPSRTVFMSVLLQANDPLVHYLASDLNSQTGALAIWNANSLRQNGNWYQSDGLAQPLPTPPTSPMGGRYQPWGQNRLMALQAGVDTNACNLAFRDPLVWGPDYWNFPSNQTWNLNWLGQVHRGTPWQTIYLKSTNILASSGNVGNQSAQNTGTNTWANWTGDLQPDAVSGQLLDAIKSAPVMDWQLVSLLAALLNTNDLRSQFSVNNADPSAWAGELDGLVVLTNVLMLPAPPEFDPITISSNSDQAAIVANAIESTRAGSPGRLFRGIGDILAAPELTVQSPFLNLSDNTQQNYGVSDEAYEAIPSQLLPFLRTDSIGQLLLTNGQPQVQFRGNDGHVYTIQVSSDLANWTNDSTNCPVNGIFSVPVPLVGNTSMQFYRSLLLQ